MTTDLSSTLETQVLMGTNNQLAELRTVEVIVGEFWSQLREANPAFNFPAPADLEAARFCLGLIQDWTLETQGRWKRFGWLHREAELALAALRQLGALLH